MVYQLSWKDNEPHNNKSKKESTMNQLNNIMIYLGQQLLTNDLDPDVRKNYESIVLMYTNICIQEYLES